MLRRKRLGWILSLPVLTFAPVHAQSINKITVFATGAAVNANSPDSISVTNNAVWVAYTNGADSTGANGSSTVVQYDLTGKVLNMYTISGYVDGLKYDAERNLVWAMQNQDGNSTLTLINPATNFQTPNSPISYSAPNSGRGYDDVVFLNGQVIMSYTNPSLPSDPVLQIISSQNFLLAFPLNATPILTMGAMGTNLATGQTNQPAPLSDPDSLKLTPTGGLMLTSEADGTLNFIDNPGQPNQSLSFLTLIDPNTGSAVTDLDDCVFLPTPAGSFYLADGGNNRVLKIDVSDMPVPSLFASVTSLNMLAKVDLTTGVVTPFLPNLKAPHGMEYVPRFTSLFGR